jgi:hypothetical protein
MTSLFRLAIIPALVSAPLFAGAAEGAGALRIPFGFTENRGQGAPAVRYIANGADMKAWFESTGFVA